MPKLGLTELIGYDSLLEAQKAAANVARTVYKDKHEAISLVYEKDGKFYYTPPVNRNDAAAGNSHASANIQIPAGSLRSLVHNHPNGVDNHLFSEDDTTMANKYKVPSVIIYGHDVPSYKIYMPGDPIDQDARGIKYALGKSLISE
jgi:hypothetical protein